MSAWSEHEGPGIRSVLPEMRADTLQALGQAKSVGGDYVKIRLAARVFIYLISHPNAIQQVLVTDQRRFVRGEQSWAPLRRMLGNGLLVADGDFHLEQRRLLNSLFTPAQVRGYAPIVTKHLEHLVQDWQSRQGKVVDMSHEMARLTLMIIGEVLLGLDLSERVNEMSDTLTEAMEVVQQMQLSFTVPYPWLPTPLNNRLRRVKRHGDSIIRDLIAQRQSGGIEDGVMYDLYRSGREAADPKLLHDQLIIFLAAGHETTANMLCWTWYLLDQHPEIRERLLQELDDVLGGRSATADDLPRLVYTDRILKESMRLYPPAWLNLRGTTEACEIQGHPLPRNVRVLMAPYLVQHDPRWFPDPERFDPDRFAPEAVSRRPRFAYFPFGGGVRQCIGQGLAELEGRLALATLGQQFVPTRLSAAPLELEPRITLRPRGGLKMRLDRRHPQPSKNGLSTIPTGRYSGESRA